MNVVFNKIRIQMLLSALIVLLGSEFSWALVKAPPERGILPNGLKVLVLEDSTLPMVSATLVFNFSTPHAASQIDPLASRGLKILRMLMEKGDSKSVSRMDLNAALEEQGCITMAFPSVVPWAGVQGHPDSLDKMLKFLRAVTFELNPTHDLLEHVKRSSRRDLQESKIHPLSSGYIQSKAIALLGGGQNIAERDAYLDDSLKGVTLEEIQSLISSTLVPNNAVLTIVGDVKAGDIFKKAMASFGDLTARRIESPKTATETILVNQVSSDSAGLKIAPTSKCYEAKEFLDVKTTQVGICFPAPSMADRDMPAAKLLSGALWGANDSWFGRVFEKEFPNLKQVSGTYYPTPDKGFIVLEFESEDPEIDPVISAILKKLANYSATPPSYGELERVATMKKSEQSIANELRLMLSFNIGLAELARDFSIAFSFNDAVDRVTPEDISKIARKIFCESSYAVYSVHPVSSKISGEKKTIEETLDNGVVLTIKPNSSSEVPALCLRLDLCPNSSIEGKQCLIDIWQAALEEKIAENFKSYNIGRELDDLGGKIKIEKQMAGVFLTAYCEKSKLKDLCRLVFDLIVNSEITPKVFEKAREKIAAQYADEQEEPVSLMEDCFRKNIFASSPLSLPTPTPEEVRNIDYSAFNIFRMKWIVAENFLITFLGNFDPQEVEKFAKPIFSKISKSEICLPQVVTASFSIPLESTKEIELELPRNSKSGYIAYGYRFPKALGNHKMRAADAAFYHLLTWSKNGILSKEIVGKGLADDIVAQTYNNSPYANYIYVLLRVPVNKLESCREAIRNLATSLDKIEIDEKVIEKASKMLESYMMLGFERSTDHAKFITLFKAWGVPLKAIEEYFKIFQVIKPEDVKQAVMENFKNYLLIVGKPAK
ncbi:MAG: insulinase family protein [Candidatus Riflebacteria bacterium]|nr:insulinase family protein [Candidatus Riflebacteria bacterium]